MYLLTKTILIPTKLLTIILSYMNKASLFIVDVILIHLCYPKRLNTKKKNFLFPPLRMIMSYFECKCTAIFVSSMHSHTVYYH